MKRLVFLLFPTSPGDRQRGVVIVAATDHDVLGRNTTRLIHAGQEQVVESEIKPQIVDSQQGHSLLAVGQHQRRAKGLVKPVLGLSGPIRNVPSAAGVITVSAVPARSVGSAAAG